MYQNLTRPYRRIGMCQTRHVADSLNAGHVFLGGDQVVAGTSALPAQNSRSRLRQRPYRQRRRAVLISRPVRARLQRRQRCPDLPLPSLTRPSMHAGYLSLYIPIHTYARLAHRLRRTFGAAIQCDVTALPIRCLPSFAPWHTTPGSHGPRFSLSGRFCSRTPVLTSQFCLRRQRF